jgi:hypothetical protein
MPMTCRAAVPPPAERKPQALTSIGQGQQLVGAQGLGQPGSVCGTSRALDK